MGERYLHTTDTNNNNAAYNLTTTTNCEHDTIGYTDSYEECINLIPLHVDYCYIDMAVSVNVNFEE